LVIAHHIILTGYGHWLPNDPRGSMSRYLRKGELGEFGPIHFGRKPRQPSPGEIRDFYRQAEGALHSETIWFDAPERRAIGTALGRVMRESRLTCYACAVLRDHAHLVVRRHRLEGHAILRLLKDASREALRAKGLVAPSHPVWSEDVYVAYKNSPQAVRAVVDYVRGNFVKHRIPAQDWGFVVAYDDWPFRKRLR